MAAAAVPRAGRAAWVPALAILVLAGLPWFLPRGDVGPRAVVTMTCVAFFAPKVLDAYAAPPHWHARPPREWLAFLLTPCLLVHRRPGPPDSPVTRRRGRRTIVRALIQMSLGAALLAWAMRTDLGRVSFWLDHGVKLLAAYMIGFDGMFLLLGGTSRACGVAVIDQSRDPVRATTPADFWRRYNREAGRWLYEDVFKPLGGLRHPGRAIVVTFLVNGALHEYLAWILIGSVQGYQMAFFALHGVATALTFRARPRTRAAKLGGFALTLAFTYFTTVLFFASVDQILPWYSRGAHPARVRADNVSPARADRPVKQGDSSDPSHAARPYGVSATGIVAHEFPRPHRRPVWCTVADLPQAGAGARRRGGHAGG